MVVQTLFILFFGLVVMIYGAELLVRSASDLASNLGISKLVIGLTIVSFGTSAPEFMVSITGALNNHTDLVIGNCIGSNIFNLLFIVGLCALISPLTVTKQIVKLDVPIMIGAHALFFFLSMNGTLNRYSGLLMLLMFFSYCSFLTYKGIKEGAILQENGEKRPDASLSELLKHIVFFIFGLLLCAKGSDWLVNSSVDLARVLGASELLIGLTIVAIGTSLPEVATSVVATIRNQKDIALGNVIGSCIFNVLGVIGVASLIAPENMKVPLSVIRFDLPIIIIASLACLPIFFTNYKISRWEGGVFLLLYGLYMTIIVLMGTEKVMLPSFNVMLLWFAIPLLGATLFSMRALLVKR